MAAAFASLFLSILSVLAVVAFGFASIFVAALFQIAGEWVCDKIAQAQEWQEKKGWM